MGKVQFLFISIINILSLSSVLAGISYDNYCCYFGICRKQIITTGPTKHTSIKNKREVGTFNNKGVNKAAEFSYQYTSSNSRKLSLGNDINPKILESEIKKSIGGELQWTKTETFKDTQKIPANKVGHAYISDKITTAIFTHKIQHQSRVSGKWKNNGPVRISKSSVITTTPELKIEIKDN